MEMKNMILLFGMVLVSLSVVSAFGVSTPYWDENPLRLAPGESMDVELVLQNMAGSDDVKVRARVAVPMNVVDGGTREVVLSFTQVGQEGAGMVSVSGGFTTKFPVFVVATKESVLFQPKPEVEVPQKSYFWVWVLVVVLVLVLVWFAWKKYRK